MSAVMSDSDDDSCVPDAKTAQARVKEFESVTNTDEIMAQMYLQVTRGKYIDLINTMTSLLRKTGGTSPEPSTATLLPSVKISRQLTPDQPSQGQSRLQGDQVLTLH